MNTEPTLAARALAAAAPAVGRSLRLRGFVRRDDGFWRVAGDFEQTVRLEAVPGRDPFRAALRVVLRLVSGRGAGQDGVESRIEVPLWDLVPGRERGSSWVVTAQTHLAAVAADIVAQLEALGVGWLDRMTALPAEVPAGSGASAFLIRMGDDPTRFETRSRWLASDRSLAGFSAVRHG